MDIVTIESFLDILNEENIKRENLSNLVVEKFIKDKLILSTAESCTGGLISKKITDVSGSSQMFNCSICSYANEIKENILKVDSDILKKYGAVSSHTATQMAIGVRKLSGSDIAVSTTGIAGPTGGSDEKPVGLVYIAVDSFKGTSCYKTMFKNEKFKTREDVRSFASDFALYLALTN